MDVTTVFSQALHIESPWYIESVDFNSPKKCLNVRVNFKAGSKFPYLFEDGSVMEGAPVHDTVEKTWRHLNFFEHECYLHVRVPRVMNTDGKVQIVSPPWAGLQHGFTLLFEAFVLVLARQMPVKPISELLNVSDYKIWEILKKYTSEARLNEDYSEVKAVGVDETSQKKHHNYISLFVDLNQRRTIFVEKGKSHYVIASFAEDLEAHKGKPGQITDVSCDMSPAFIKGINKNLPNAKITFDKFHIIKLCNEAVEKIRRSEVKENPILKNSRYALLKNEDNRSAKDKQKFEELSMPELNLGTMRAVHYRENFKAIYKAESEAEFVALLTKWYEWAIESDLKPIRDVAEMVKSHWEGVVEWKRSQLNNGILEGLNSVIQAAKAKARGFRNFEYFKTIVYLITGKLDYSKINSYCLPT